jgi:hypothetical protein
MFLMALALSAIEPPPRPMEVELVHDAINDNLRAYAIQRDHRKPPRRELRARPI